MYDTKYILSSSDIVEGKTLPCVVVLSTGWLFCDIYNWDGKGLRLLEIGIPEHKAVSAARKAAIDLGLPIIQKVTNPGDFSRRFKYVFCSKWFSNN